jgi:hypothetical protein
LASKCHRPFQVIKKVSWLPINYVSLPHGGYMMYSTSHFYCSIAKQPHMAPTLCNHRLTLLAEKKSMRSRPFSTTDVIGGLGHSNILSSGRGYPHSNNTWELADQVHAPDLNKSYHHQYLEAQDKRARVHAVVSAPPKPTPT